MELCRPHPADLAQEPAAARHQRVDGAARIAFAAPGRLADLYQRAPCRILFPDVEPSEPVEAVSVTTSGGLTGGDRIRVEVAIAAGAAATVTTQAAEKLYRVLPGDPDIRIETRVSVGAGGWGEWLGQEAILFEGTRVARAFEADVAVTGRLLAVESLVFGRSAMGEAMRTGRVHDSWRIRRDGRLLWVDALRLEGDVAAAMAAPFAFGDATSSATIVYVADDAARHLDAARALIAGDRGGATSFDGMLIVRLLAADAAALRRAVVRIAAGLRAAAGGFAGRMPAIWRC
ncbi:urease accessory protein UreD [Sphingomonas profundi]|uniref:urease accessory protein UreD n=1 Tax=Alterirhizorhabdus profundi TaxID=2681549 RepID=UPI0012E8EBEA|nr:urease accessory protein UreD [Sphingomonas profundi]